MISKLLGTTILALALLSTQASAAETPKVPVAQVTQTADPKIVELQQEAETLKIYIETVKDQRNSILDQLTAAQVLIRQLQTKK